MRLQPPGRSRLSLMTSLHGACAAMRMGAMTPARTESCSMNATLATAFLANIANFAVTALSRTCKPVKLQEENSTLASKL